MTSLTDRRRGAATWIVIGVVTALAIVATVLTVGLLKQPADRNQPDCDLQQSGV